jgi:hypothetical protein
MTTAMIIFYAIYAVALIYVFFITINVLEKHRSRELSLTEKFVLLISMPTGAFVILLLLNAIEDEE